MSHEATWWSSAGAMFATAVAGYVVDLFQDDQLTLRPPDLVIAYLSSWAFVYYEIVYAGYFFENSLRIR